MSFFISVVSTPRK